MLKRIWDAIRPRTQREVIEDYLSNAQDHADLERRLKTVDRIYGYHWNH